MKAVGAAAVKLAKRPKPDIWAALIFGADDGVVADAASDLIKAWSPKSAPTELITLDEDQIKREPATLFDALEAQSLLGDTRIIRIRLSGEKIGALLLEAIKLGDSAPDRMAAKLVIQAGNLQKKSKLRAGIEAAQYAMALQTFADEVGDISARIVSDLRGQGVEIGADALATFSASLPGHRGLAHAEIEKLALYARNLGRSVSIDDVRALSATDVDHAIGDLVNTALAGHMTDAQSNLTRLMVAGTSAISVYRALQRETQRMLSAHAHMGTAGGNVGIKLRPPVWKTEWPAYHQKLMKWPPARLSRILERLYDAELQAKRAGPSADPMMRVLITDIARVAARAKT